MPGPVESGNPFLSAIRDGRQTFGIWSMTPGGFIAEVVASTPGVDYVCIDQQHGMLDFASVIPMAQGVTAGGAIPLTRVTDNQPAEIGKSLDAGVFGVIVPMVNGREEAERAVVSCRFPPRGIRSFGPARASVVQRSRDPERLDQVACIVMVETAAGFEALDEIASTPGIDAIYIGPSDLALALDLPPARVQQDPRFVEAVEAIRRACERHGIASGIHCLDGEIAGRYAEQGFNIVTVSTDVTLLAGAATQHVDTARRRSRAEAILPAET